MLTAVAEIITALVFVVQVVAMGTNISLVRMMWAMVQGSFLVSRGAIHSGLLSSNFTTTEIRRSWAALRYGSWQIGALMATWPAYVASRQRWQVRR